MFGLSISKILLVALIIGAVIVGTRVLGQIGRGREVARRRQAGGDDPPPSVDGPVDLVACEKCGTFHSPGKAADCGRTGCPYAP